MPILKKLVYILLMGVAAVSLSCDRSGSDKDQKHLSSGLYERESASIDISPEFEEAFNVIQTNFLMFDPRYPVQIKDPGSMRKYLHQMDPSSDYMPRDEYKAFKHSQKKKYVGVGMEIEKNDAGEIICFPFPNSPAFKAGVDIGDVLLSVNGQNIKGLTIFSVAEKLLGQQGSMVSILIRKKKNKEKLLNIRRQVVTYHSITQSSPQGIPVVKIHSFSSSTKWEIKFVLMDLNDPPFLVLDMRDNPGGNFYQAIDSAMLFLPEDDVIASVQQRKKVQDYTSTTQALNKTSNIVIWQNEKTASAAEIFIAALTENDRAVSIGKKSYGKGTTQEIFELSNGSALFLTIGYLLTPAQISYHKIGLLPAHKLHQDDPGTEDYMEKTKQILQPQA